MTRPTRPTLRFDWLEAREVPASAVLTGGDLVVTGTGAAETITVDDVGSGRLNVRATGGLDRTFDVAAVQTIRIDAGAGDDTVILSQTDVTTPAVIQGGDGNDSIWGGLGADYIDGQSGDDWILGEGGADKLAGDTGDDVIFGGDGNDSIAGGAGMDGLQGNGGVDRLWGGTGLDHISGGAGRDHVYDDFSPLAVIVDDTNYVHHHILGLADNSGFGWFDANMPDGDLRRQARLAARNNYLGRTELLDLFERATDGPDVNNNEFAALKNLVNTDQVRFSGPARYFGQRIMNGDPANQWFTGGERVQQPLGDLHAGDPDDHLQRLIDKWFLGKDHPLAKSGDRHDGYDYRAAGGQLFVNGPGAADIAQGDVGDCYFLAGLGAVARQDARRIRDLFTDNGDGTWTVRLFHDNQAAYVTVDRYLPATDGGSFVFASDGGGRAVSDPANELWAALAEKAYAQANESGWLGQDGTNSYNGFGGAVGAAADNHAGLNGGASDLALRQIAGVHTDVGLVGLATFAAIRAKFDAGKAVTFSTPDGPPDARVVGSHVYYLVGYDAAHQTLTLRNPWGPGDAAHPEQLTLSFASVKANFLAWASADV